MNLMPALPLLLLLAGEVALAAAPVYRCETAGKVAYSDLPCVGATLVDATPNQGIDQMSGKSRKGRDVQRTEMNHAFDDALRPLTGLPRERMDVVRHRVSLSSTDQGECRRLDLSMQRLDVETGRGAVADRAQADVALYRARKQFHDLRC